MHASYVAMLTVGWISLLSSPLMLLLAVIPVRKRPRAIKWCLAHGALGMAMVSIAILEIEEPYKGLIFLLLLACMSRIGRGVADTLLREEER